MSIFCMCGGDGSKEHPFDITCDALHQEKHTCQHPIHSGFPSYHCGLPHFTLKEGKFVCKRHSRAAEEARRKKSEDKYDKEMAIKHHEWDCAALGKLVLDRLFTLKSVRDDLRAVGNTSTINGLDEIIKKAQEVR